MSCTVIVLKTSSTSGCDPHSAASSHCRRGRTSCLRHNEEAPPSLWCHGRHHFDTFHVSLFIPKTLFSSQGRSSFLIRFLKALSWPYSLDPSINLLPCRMCEQFKFHVWLGGRSGLQPRRCGSDPYDEPASSVRRSVVQRYTGRRDADVEERGLLRSLQGILA